MPRSIAPFGVCVLAALCACASREPLGIDAGSDAGTDASSDAGSDASIDANTAAPDCAIDGCCTGRGGLCCVGQPTCADGWVCTGMFANGINYCVMCEETDHRCCHATQTRCPAGTACTEGMCVAIGDGGLDTGP
jgi:hypothetical protein